MKISVVYTATTPELITGINEELQKTICDKNIEIASYQDPSILQDARDAGGLTPKCARNLITLYEQAVSEGADLILNVCSSVGEVARLAKPLYELSGTRFVRIDEDMANAAVKVGARIGVIATLPTTLEPTKQLIRQCAETQGRKTELIDALADGAFGLDREQFKQKLIDTGRKVIDKVDVLLFAQGSMAYAEKDVSEALGVPVFSSIRFGVAAVANEVAKMAK